MDRLADDPEARESLGQRGRELARRRFHIQAVADAYEHAYGELRSQE
jgi:hypothetical protein